MAWAGVKRSMFRYHPVVRAGLTGAARFAAAAVGHIAPAQPLRSKTNHVEARIKVANVEAGKWLF
jgi:hypothetical protein